MLIGVCGKSCSGKSTFSSYLTSIYGNKIVCVDIDKIGHDVLNIPKVQLNLVLAFGESIIENGIVSRKRLGSIVFSSPQEMDKLTNATWPFMENLIDKVIRENSDKIVVLDWQLLPKTKYMTACDLKILFDIPYEVRKKRAFLRDNITESDFELRDSASLDFQKEDFDFVLENNEKETIREVMKLL